MPNFHMHDDLNEVVDEKGNISIAIRKVNWGEESDLSKAKVDIRRWFINKDGEEAVGKGLHFLTEDGPHTLARVLVEKGFGKTRDILIGIKDRQDFRSSLNTVLGKEDEFYDASAGDDFFAPDESFYSYEKE